MSNASSSSSKAAAPISGKTVENPLDFGPTHVTMPTGRHQATIVWLHGLGDSGYICSQLMGSLPLQNVKWIFPTAPTRPVPTFARLPGAAWFDPRDLTEENPSSEVDIEGLNATAEHVKQLFSNEPLDVKLAVGGFSIGAAAALYTATHYVLGEHLAQVSFLGNLSTVVVLSGWLPLYRSLKKKIDESSLGTVLRVKALHVCIAHGTDDDVVSTEHGERCAYLLQSLGFTNLAWKKFEGLGHDTSGTEMKALCCWLNDALKLQGF